MLTDYECMLILSGNICSELLSASLSFDILQKSNTDPKANCFIGIPSVLSKINPGTSPEGDKLKFLISYKPGIFSDLEYAAICFSKEVTCNYEIRVKNEITESGEARFSMIKISLQNETPEKIDLEFISDNGEEADKLNDLSESLHKENDLYENKINELNKIISDEIQEKAKNELEISKLNAEIENIRKTTHELENLRIQKDKIEKDIENREDILLKTKDYSNKLSVYGEILDFYKNEDGYASAGDKLIKISHELNEIREYLDSIIKIRTAEADKLNDELNI